MSKKLIAVASAAALALSVLVGVAPSSANFALAVTGGSDAAGAIATAPKTIPVPSANTIEWSTEDNTTGTAIRVVVATAAAAGAVTVASTGGVKLLTTAEYDATGDDAATSATGAQSLSGLAVSNSFTFYVTTTSTATGTFTVTEGANSTVRYVKGIAGPAYKLTATAPTVLSPGIKSEILVKVVDAFGNAVTGLAAGNFTVTHLGGSVLNTTDSATGTAYRTASGDQALFIQGTASAGPAAITVQVTGNEAQVAAANITAFGSRDLTKFLSITNQDLTGVVIALQAQVAALQATIADMRTKARSVTLKRWNNLVLRHRALGGSAKLK
jgi:hypothetical protein